MKWIGPLFRNAGGWEAFVAYENDRWYVDKENTVEIDSDKSGVMLLPMLQKGYGEDYSTQIEILQNGLSRNGQDPDLAYGFPFGVPVLVAYKTMQNWTSEAVNWLPDIELDRDSALAIFDACYYGGINQSVRQKTISFINKWSNQKGYQFTRPRC